MASRSTRAAARCPSRSATRPSRRTSSALRAPTSCVLWVASVDYTDDQRIGPEILKAVSDNYRKLRNTIRWMLGTLAHREPGDSVGYAAMTGLERLMLHKLAELDLKVREAYEDFDFARVVALLTSVHERRPFRLLFRHPQGRALLRRAVQRPAARRAGGDRAHLPRGDDLARAGARFHRRGSLGGARATRVARSISNSFPSIPARMARRRTGEDLGDDPGAASRCHRRDRNRAGRQADRLVPRSCAARLSEQSRACEGARRRRLRGSLHHLGHCDRVRQRRSPTARFVCPKRPDVGVVVERARGVKCAALLALLRSRDRFARFSRRNPSRRARRCASSKPWAACSEAARCWEASSRSLSSSSIRSPKSAFWRISAGPMSIRAPLAPFLDLTLRLNRGISFSLFARDSASGQAALLALTLAATGLLAWWLVRSRSALPAVGLGLIIGGALGNAIDRLAHGAVIDYLDLHAFGPSLLRLQCRRRGH